MKTWTQRTQKQCFPVNLTGNNSIEINREMPLLCPLCPEPTIKDAELNHETTRPNRA